MAQIGHFVRTQLGYAGRLRTLSLNLPLVFVPADDSDVENAPDYRIRVGAARRSLAGAANPRPPVPIG